MAVPVITSAANAQATAGVAFTYNITASNVPTSYNATPLPAWLSVNTSTGAVTGTPPDSVSPPVITISATNADGTGSATLTIRVELNSGLIGTNARKSDWFAKNGYPSTSLADQMSRWLAANGGGISNDLNTQWYTFLAGKGRTPGAINDMYRAELIASVSGNSGLSLTDLENMFYSASGNTFA